jgi:Ca2+-binding EF-hand superfamily protein
MSNKPTDYEMLKEMFKAFDKDNNGYIGKFFIIKYKKKIRTNLKIL